MKYQSQMIEITNLCYRLENILIKAFKKTAAHSD